MALEHQRRLLDQLMGANRNGDRKSNVAFTDRSICKDFLCGACPRELFQHTKRSLGTCNLQHDYGARSDYQKALRRGERYPFEEDWVRYLRRLVEDGDAIIKAEKDRLETEYAEQANHMDPVSLELRSRADGLAETIAMCAAQMEQHAAEGEIDEAQAKLEVMEKLKVEKENAEEAIAERQNRRMERLEMICDTCGAQIVTDTEDERYISHMVGRLHTAFVTLRESLKNALKRSSQVSTSAYNSASASSPSPSSSSSSSSSSASSSSHSSSRRRYGSADRSGDSHSDRRDHRDYRKDRHKSEHRDHRSRGGSNSSSSGRYDRSYSSDKRHQRRDDYNKQY